MNRTVLTGELSARCPGMDFSYLGRQKGMFSYSGLTDEQFRRLIELGMRKINVATDIFMAQAGACGGTDVFRNIRASTDAVRAVVERYIRLFGGEGKAQA